VTSTSFNPAEAPMAHDRTAGWKYFRSFGDVFEGADGQWYLTSADNCQFAYSHPEIFSSAKAFDTLGSPIPLVPIAIDPPAHVRYRRVLDPMLAPRVINGMEEELRRQIGLIVDDFAATGSFDAVDDLARLYPTQVFLTVAGMPLEDRDQFIAWSEFIIENSVAGLDAAAPEVLEAAGAVFAYIGGFIEQKRANPGDDILSKVLQLEGEDKWSDEELFGMVFLFVLAGLDTVTASIGFALYHLARDLELQARLRANHELIPSFIEEVLRLEPPAPIGPRVTLSEVEVDGVLIPESARINVVLGAANRDERRFPKPDGFSLETADRSHFAFGGGVHRCLGSHLAKRELKLVLEELFGRIGTFSLAPGAEPEIVWPSGTSHLKSVDLVFEPLEA
jgi:cytochrome P450